MGVGKRPHPILANGSLEHPGAKNALARRVAAVARRRMARLPNVSREWSWCARALGGWRLTTHVFVSGMCLGISDSSSATGLGRRPLDNGQATFGRRQTFAPISSWPPRCLQRVPPATQPTARLPSEVPQPGARSVSLWLVGFAKVAQAMFVRTCCPMHPIGRKRSGGPLSGNSRRIRQ